MTALDTIRPRGATAPIAGYVRGRPDPGPPEPPSDWGEPSARGRDPLPAGAGAAPFRPWVPVAAFLALQIAELDAGRNAAGWGFRPDPDGESVLMPVLERGLAAYRVGLGRTVSYLGPVSPVDLRV